MTNNYTSIKKQGRFLHLLGIFTVLMISWLFSPPAIQPVFAASSTHQVFATVQPGDTLYSLFKKQHISPKTLSAILRLPIAANELKHLRLNQHIRFSLDAKNNLESLALSLGASKTLLVYKAGSRYIARIEKGSFRVPANTQKKPAAPKAISATKTKIAEKPVPSKPAQLTKQQPSVNTANKKIPPQQTKIQTTKTSIAIKTPLPNSKKTVSPVIPQKNTQTSVKKAPSTQVKTKPIPQFPPLHYAGMIIHNSFYGDAKKYGIPDSVINQIIQIFSLQVNFKNTHAGDKLLVAYDNDKDVIAAEFFQGKRIYSAIQYVNAQGKIEYFTPDGESMKKAFTRFPVKYTHINSLFNMHRMHPVTHVIRPHTGVDLAGALGTPVYSIGDGQVSFIGWEGAYGNIVKIQHNDKYSSMYAHLLRFAPNLSQGMSVKRGQLIGYLGQTGNATGPHVHFEVRVYNVPVNPLTVPLPQASSVPAAQMKTYHERAQTLIAALNYYQKNYLK